MCHCGCKTPFRPKGQKHENDGQGHPVIGS